MDLFDEDILHFWTSLNKHGVKYIMIGGVATNFHGYQRTTDDIDVWIEDTPENRARRRIALKEYSRIDYFMLESLQIVPGWTHFNLNNGFRLDLMTEVKGLEKPGFNDCLSMAYMADLGSVQIPFLHIDHLIQSKKAANRPKDQVDLINLEKIRKIQEDEGINKP